MHGVREGEFAGGLPYLAFGEGRPLVYLGGFTATHTVPPPGPQRAITARVVRPFVDAGYRVYWTNRQRGMPAGSTMADVAAVHAKALADAFVGPVPVVGHSTGGSIALQLGLDHPAVVERLVLASTAYALGPVAKRAQRRMLDEAGRGRSGLRYGADGFTRHRALQWLLYGLIWCVDQVHRPPDDPSDMIAMLTAEDGFDVRTRLGEMRPPVLVICGARDYLWPQQMFVETARRIPRGRLVMYPKAGHGVITMRAFYRDVLRFLREEPMARELR